MKSKKTKKILSKNLIKVVLFILLLIPIFFGVLKDYVFVINFELLGGFLALILIGVLFLLGLLINKLLIQEKTLNKIVTHEVVYSLVNRKNWVNIWLIFPVTLTIEELIFRYYLIGFMLLIPNINIWMPILISSIAFSVYHIHVWFAYKNVKIFLNYLIYTLLMGLIIGVLFIWYGLIFCIFIHILIALSMYYDIAARIRARLVKT